MNLPAWPPRDWRAIIALVASVGGSGVLTAFACWLVYILWRGGWPETTALARIDKIGLALIIVLVIMGVTMTSLGLAINRRSVKASAFGTSFEATGGDDAPAAAQAVADAATDKAEEIKGTVQ